eukprot:214753_1
MTVLLLYVDIGDTFNPILDLCAAPATKGSPSFNQDTQYLPIEYANEDTIKQYDDMFNSDLVDWPFSHGAWGFKAATISMTNSGTPFSENILIPAIPIYIPQDNKPHTIAKPRGKYFYVFSSEPATNENAIVIEFRYKDEPQPIDSGVLGHLRIMTKPTIGMNDEDGKFCDSSQTEGMCFGDSDCCNAFDNLLSKGIREGSTCRTIVLCPKGVIRIDLYDWMADAAQHGWPPKDGWPSKQTAIYGVEYTRAEQDKMKELKLLFTTEANYICPDGTYHIHLNCPVISHSFKGRNIGRREKGNIDEDAFIDCPFCSVPDHKYQIILPSDDVEVRGKCSKNDKKTRPSFGFTNKNRDYMSCCIESHTRASNHLTSAYKQYSVNQDIEKKMSEASDGFQSENKFEEEQ